MKTLYSFLALILALAVTFASGFEVSAESVSSASIVSPRCRGAYVPPTTMKELNHIKIWALSNAFIEVAYYAGYAFDLDLYSVERPNPNPAVFNFGFVTGYECYPIDVLSGYVSYKYVLSNLRLKNPVRFLEYFNTETERYDLKKYLIPLIPTTVDQTDLAQVSF